MARRSIDIAFTKAKVAVFLDGCFWHGCPEHGTQPRANADWWDVKLRRNMARDVETDGLLEAAGWRVIVITVEDMKRPQTIVTRVRQALR